jgi:peptide/nickel transport system permease protein
MRKRENIQGNAGIRIGIFFLKKALTSLALFLLISIFVFVAFSIVPGDPSQQILADGWTPAGGAALDKQLGLDDPIPVRYVRFVWKAMHGDLGISYKTRLPVFSTVVTALKNSAQLAAVAVLIVLLLAVPVGTLAGIRRNSGFDATARTVAVLLSSIPTFVLGIVFIYIFAANLHILPSEGMGSLRNLVLPALTLSLFSFAGLLRMTRASVLEILPQDYVRAARARGIAFTKIIIKYVLRNAAIPLVTLGGLYAAEMIGTAVITEYIFAWPGLGTTAITAIQSRDIPMIQGSILTIAAIYIVVNSILDISYGIIDPRLRSGDGSS